LAKATTYSYDVGITSLKVGINGDYTVKSSDDLYSNMAMQEKLLHAYTEKSLGKKTLIFNNGINTSLYVYETFREAGFQSDIWTIPVALKTEEKYYLGLRKLPMPY
jgi:hypothetical protein